MSIRRCHYCEKPISPLARADARYCSTRCRVAAHRARHAPPALPAEIMGRDRWIRHRAKRPLTIDDRPASSTDPATWAPFADAQASAVGDGLGFVLNGDGIVCLDLDHCLDAGHLEPWAANVLAMAPPTYTEISPSGHGLHVWGTGNVPRGRIRRLVPGGTVEVYGSGRYLTVTGERFGNAPAELGELDSLIAALWL